MRASKVRTLVIILVVATITFFHYSTELEVHRYHIFYQGLYFVPILLAGLWFGLRGGLRASLSITMLYLPFTILHWAAFSAEDINSLLEMVLYNLVAVVLGILRDREKKDQLRLREAENLAAIGKAVSFLAHDMKTPLIAIGGFSRSIKSNHKSEEKDHEKLDIIIQEAQRLENMVREMLDFSRPLELHASTHDLQPVIKESLEVVRDMADEKRVELRVQSAQGLPPGLFEAMRMKQVLINLLNNAVEASPEGGIVSVATFQKGKSLFLEVSDQGSGILSHKKSEVFLPFFSTKKGGTGLGLTIVKKIVEAHRGRVEILDNPKKGTIFRIILPLA
jgi:two-component system, NtrC family, sensor histidine kinase HydH